MNKQDIINALKRYKGQSPRIDIIVRDLRNEDENAMEFVEYLANKGLATEADLFREIGF